MSGSQGFRSTTLAPPPARWLSALILCGPAILCAILGFTLRGEEKHVRLAVFFLISIPGSILAGMLSGIRLAARYARTSHVGSGGVAAFILFCVSSSFVACVAAYLTAVFWPVAPPE